MGIEQNMTDKGILLRGKFLHEVVMLEKMIDTFLAMYYAQKNKQAKFFYVFLSKTEFKRKLETFVQTIGKYKNPFKLKYKKYSAELHNIKDIRNIFAHDVLDTSESSLRQYEIGFLTFKNFREKNNTSVLSVVEIENNIALIQMYALGIHDLLEKD